VSPTLRRTATTALAAYGVALVAVLLYPSDAGPSAVIDHVSAAGRRLGLPGALADPLQVEFLLNCLILAPATFLGSLLLPRISVLRWAVAGCAVSSVVELAQLALPDRTATVADVVANTLGAALGAACARGLRDPEPGQ
jgi:hypothetical protein